MLGYMIYFFPLAGFSRELIELCKTTVLRRDPTLCLEQTASAQRAMGAYLRRMAEIMDGSQNDAHETTNIICPYPSASCNTPVEDVAHNFTGHPDNRQEKLDKTTPMVSEIGSDSANPQSTHTTVAPIPVDLEILVSPAASQGTSPPAKIPNDSGTKVKKSKMDFVSRLWHARKRT